MQASAETFRMTNLDRLLALVPAYFETAERLTLSPP